MKRKMMTTFLALVMAAAMLLVGCGGNAGIQPETKGNTAETSALKETVKETEAEETWTCIIPWPSIGAEPAGMADVEAAVNAITVPEINVAIEFSPIYCYDLTTEQQLAVSSGEKTDLILEMFSGNAVFINSESIIPLDDLYAQYGANIDAAIGGMIDCGKVGGTLYSIPKVSQFGSSQGYVVRTDSLEKYGYSTENRDVTMEEINEMFKTIKAGEGDSFYMITGMNAFQSLHTTDFLGYSDGSAGVLLVNKDAKQVVNMFATEEYAAYAQMCYEWTQNGYISGDAIANGESNTQNIATGNYFGMVLNTTPGMDQWASNTANYPMTMLTVTDAISSTSDIQTVMWSISVTCDRPDKAMQLLNLMYTDNRLGNLMTYGLEGADYVISESDEAGNMIIAFPEGLDSTTIPYYCMFGVWPNATCQFAPYTMDYFTQLEAYNAGCKQTPAFGYVFDSSEVSTQLSAVQAVITQYANTISAGAADPATVLPNFLNDLEAAGYADIIAANQAQLDAHLAQ